MKIDDKPRQPTPSRRWPLALLALAGVVALGYPAAWASLRAADEHVYRIADVPANTVLVVDAPGPYLVRARYAQSAGAVGPARQHLFFGFFGFTMHLHSGTA